MDSNKSVSGTGVLSLLLINLFFFAILNALPTTSNYLLLDPTVEFMLQRPWTLLSVFFSHENIVHLASNMFLLLYFGYHLEKIVGVKKVILIYVTSGLIGSLTMPMIASLIQWEGIAAGASGACFGIVGALAAIKPNHKFIKEKSKLLNVLMGGNVMTFAILMFGMNLFLFISNPEESVGAGAHAFGLIFGWIVGLYQKANLYRRII